MVPALTDLITSELLTCFLVFARIGTAMMILPMFAEQPGNAARVAELGAGRWRTIEDVTPDALHEDLLAVLEDPGYRACAREMQRRIRALPPLSQLPADLASLVRS